jgi:hypothetical protein
MLLYDKKCLAFFEKLVSKDSEKLRHENNFEKRHNDFIRHASVKAKSMDMEKILKPLPAVVYSRYVTDLSPAEKNLICMQLYDVFYDDKKSQKLSSTLEKFISKCLLDKKPKSFLSTHIPFFAKPIQILPPN